ncbi:hypothetical protein Trydic_g3987 [Trypoxylus dichotomus]
MIIVHIFDYGVSLIIVVFGKVFFNFNFFNFWYISIASLFNRLTCGVAFFTEDKAEAIAKTPEGECSPVYENEDVKCIGRVHQKVREIFTTSPEEMNAVIKAFRSSKASGPDGITYRALKHAPWKFIMHMTEICNTMFRLRHFLSQWK